MLFPVRGQTRFAPETFIGVISSRPRLTKSNHSLACTFSDSRGTLRKKNHDDQSASLSYRYCDYSALLFYCLCEYKKECSEWPTRHVWRRHWRYDAQTSNPKYQRRSWFVWRFLWCSRRWIVSRSWCSKFTIYPQLVFMITSYQGTENLYKINLIGVFCFSGGVCGRAVITSNCQGFKPRPSRCFLRQRTLLHFVSLRPGV